MNIEEEFKKIVEKLKPHELPVVKITPHANAPEKPWNSKFGGNPYWLKDAEYPHTKEGKPLFLLAQINFAEVPALEGYPTTGLLQFFIKDDADDYLFGCDFIDNNFLEEVFKSTDGYHVIYHADVVEDSDKLQTDFVDTEIECTPLGGEYAISFEVITDTVSQFDYRFEQIIGDVTDINEELDELLYDELNNHCSKIGGYAHFTQQDPRSYTQSDKNWLLLFQMDSEYADDVDIMWGDAGVANFFIEPERLAQRDFSRVWYNWDCS